MSLRAGILGIVAIVGIFSAMSFAQAQKASKTRKPASSAHSRKPLHPAFLRIREDFREGKFPLPHELKLEKKWACYSYRVDNSTVNVEPEKNAEMIFNPWYGTEEDRTNKRMSLKKIPTRMAWFNAEPLLKVGASRNPSGDDDSGIENKSLKGQFDDPNGHKQFFSARITDQGVLIVEFSRARGSQEKDWPAPVDGWYDHGNPQILDNIAYQYTVCPSIAED
jgi:hypothetical protein